jgi:transposase
MTAQHSTAALYMAMELSNSRWRLRFGNGSAVHDKTVKAGDQAGRVEAIGRARTRLKGPAEAPVRSCYEAGRDGFWLHRFLQKHGVENLVVDPASIEVNRRQHHAKTDRLDAEKLLLMLLRYHLYGEKTVWKICRVPAAENEDERRVNRELERLTKERTGHMNRIRALLVIQGVAGVKPATVDLEAVADWEGKALAPALAAELKREPERLRLVSGQIRQIEAARNQRLAEPQSDADRKASKRLQLRGVGPVSSSVLAKELFGWRQFRNRREVGAVAGLTGTPYDSGAGRREQGISKSGSRWVRTACVELAWNWLRFQPQSQLSEWFAIRFGGGGKRQRRTGIVALARKLLVALWRYVEHDELPAGAVLSIPRVRKAC